MLSFGVRFKILQHLQNTKGLTPWVICCFIDTTLRLMVFALPGGGQQLPINIVC